MSAMRPPGPVVLLTLALVLATGVVPLATASEHAPGGPGGPDGQGGGPDSGAPDNGPPANGTRPGSQNASSNRSSDDGPRGASGEGRGPPTWVPARHDDGARDLPLALEGRFFSLNLTADGLRDLTIHGTLLGDVDTPVGPLDSLAWQGSRFQATSDGFFLEVRDVPALRLTVEGPALTTAISGPVTLASGVVLTTEAGDDRLEIEASPPRDSVGRGPPTELQPALVEPTPGGGPPGLRASAPGHQLDVSAARPGTLRASFSGELDGAIGTLDVDVGLTRALLVDDLDGDGRVSVGEPALAVSELANGTSFIEGTSVRTVFPLWAGNLTVIAELDAQNVKVTYVADDLMAPPGTLFVLESVVDAPPDAALRPTPRGVQVTSGNLEAHWDVGGPVTVDGDDAWARHSVLVHDDGRVFVLLMYPAGDDIVHDPTLSVQSVGAVVVGAVQASPYAVLAGALVAAVAVGATFFARRQR